MDPMWAHRTGERSLWCHVGEPMDSDVFRDLLETLSNHPRITYTGDEPVDELVARFAAGVALAVQFRHDERRFGFTLVVHPGERWFEVDDSIPSRGHLSWLSFVNIWAEVFDAQGFAFGTVQSGRPPDELGSDVLREVSELLLYGAGTAGEVGRGRLLSTPALAVRELDGGGVVVLVDREATEPVRRHLAGEDIDDAEPAVPLPPELPSPDCPDDAIGMLAYLGDWIPRGVVKFELRATDHLETTARLRRLLTEDRDRVRREAAWGLGEVAVEYIGESKFSDDPTEYRERLDDLSESVVALVERTDDDSAAVRKAAADALGWLPTTDSLEALARLVREEPSTEVRVTAAEEFGVAAQRSPDAPRSYLRNVLGHAYERDPSPGVRSAALESLGPGGGAIGFEYLIEGLEDSDESVRDTAVRMIGLRLVTPAIRDPEPIVAVIEKHARTIASLFDDEPDRLEQNLEHQDIPAMADAIRTLIEHSSSDE